MFDTGRKEGEEGDSFRLAVFVEFVVHVRWLAPSAGMGEYESVVVAWRDDDCLRSSSLGVSLR